MKIFIHTKEVFWALLISLIFQPRGLFADSLTQKPGDSLTQKGCDPNKLCNPIKYDNINDFLLAILNVVIQYGAILIVFFIVFAGFQFVTAQGNAEKIEHAKKMLLWIIVGAFVLLGVFVLRAAICGTLTQIGVQNLKCTE